MSRTKAALACICVILSFAAPVTGEELKPVASGKWDLWDDSGGSSKPDGEKHEAPAETRAEADDVPVRDTADMKAGEVERPAASDDAARPQDSKAGRSAAVTRQPVKVEGDKAETDRPVNSAVSDQPASSASFEEAAGTIPAAAGKEYIIGPGDLLDISVWKDEVLSRTVVVLADGTVSFPLIGKVRASGRTIDQVKNEIVGKLVRYYPEPEVSMEVKQSNSMLIYIIGRVNAPGRQVLNANIDVIQALAMAGGLNPFASRNKIKVLRKDGGKTIVLPFRYGDVVEGKIDTNIELKRGDVIVVP